MHIIRFWSVGTAGKLWWTCYMISAAFHFTDQAYWGWMFFVLAYMLHSMARAAETPKDLQQFFNGVNAARDRRLNQDQIAARLQAKPFEFPFKEANELGSQVLSVLSVTGLKVVKQ